MQDQNYVKELAFVTITMLPLDSDDQAKADFEVKMTNVDTAAIKTVKFTFKPDHRLGRRDFPINRDHAEALIVDAMKELIQKLPAEFLEKHDTHYATANVFDKLLAMVNREVKDYSTTPAPIVTAIGTITFVQKPTADNFESLDALPDGQLHGVIEGTGQVIDVLFKLTKPDYAVSSNMHYHSNWGRHDKSVMHVDMMTVRNELKDQLKDAFEPYKLTVRDVNFTPTRPNAFRPGQFNGYASAQPEVPLSKHEVDQMGWESAVDVLTRSLTGLDRRFPSFTVAEHIDQNGSGQEEIYTAVSLHLGGGYYFQTGGKYIDGKQHRGFNAENTARGSVDVLGEKSSFIITQRRHGYNPVIYDVRDLMSPEALLSLIKQAANGSLTKISFAHLIDLNTLQFDPIEG